MKMYLIGRGLWDIVQGAETVGDEPSDDDRKKFKKRENLALASICLSVSTGLQIYVRNSKSGKEAWEHLANHFEEKTLSKKIFYRRKLYACRMDKSTSMVNHVNHVKTLSEHLEAVDDPVIEKDLVMILISSLPEEYNNLITALETLSEDKLTWDYVRDRVIHEYERKKKSGGKGSAQDALFCDNYKSSKFPNKNWNNKFNQKSNNNFRCHFCNEKGHFKRDCPKFKAAEKNKVHKSNIANCE